MLQLFNTHHAITDYWNVVDILVVEKNTGNKILSASFDIHSFEILDHCGASVPPFPVVPLPSSFSFPPILLLVWFFLHLDNLLDHSFQFSCTISICRFLFFLLDTTDFTSTCGLISALSFGFCLTWTVGSSLESRSIKAVVLFPLPVVVPSAGCSLSLLSDALLSALLLYSALIGQAVNYHFWLGSWPVSKECIYDFEVLEFGYQMPSSFLSCLFYLIFHLLVILSKLFVFFFTLLKSAIVAFIT